MELLRKKMDSAFMEEDERMEVLRKEVENVLIEEEQHT
jgi:hypothetical protein